MYLTIVEAHKENIKINKKYIFQLLHLGQLVHLHLPHLQDGVYLPLGPPR